MTAMPIVDYHRLLPDGSHFLLHMDQTLTVASAPPLIPPKGGEEDVEALAVPAV